MIKHIRHYWGIYKHFIATNIAEASSYRAHFVLLIFMDLLFYFSTFASIDFIFNHVTAVGLWSRPEFMFFVAFLLTVDHIHMSLVSENFWMFSAAIRLGTLDFDLLKPVSLFFISFFRHIRSASLINTVIIWPTLVYFGVEAGLTAWQWVMLPLLILLALTLFVSLDVLMCALMFWIVESMGINFLRIQIQQVARWPDFIYRGIIRRFFLFFFPVLLIGNAPVRFLFNWNDWTYLAGLGAAILICWMLIRVAFKVGLHRYESASS